MFIYPRCEYDALEPLEDWFAGDGGVHAAEVEDGIVNGRGTVIKRLNDQTEPCNWYHQYKCNSSIYSIIIIIILLWYANNISIIMLD